MLCFLISLPPDWVVYQSNLKDMLAGETKYSISKVFAELEANGYIEKRKVKGEGGKFSGWDYIVYSEPFDDSSEEIPKPATQEKPVEVKQKKENTSALNETEKQSFEKFQAWLTENCVLVTKLRQPLTGEQYVHLFKHYDKDGVLSVLEDMGNFKQLTAKYVSAFKTCLNWLKKRNVPVKGTETPQISTNGKSTGRKRFFKNPPVYRGENAKYAHWFDELEKIDRHPLWEIADEYGTIDYSNTGRLEKAAKIVMAEWLGELIPDNNQITEQPFAVFSGGYVQPLGIEQQQKARSCQLKANQILKGIIL